MVIQYPHIATITSQGTDTTQDENGNWIPGTPGTSIEQKCRAESSGGNGYVKGVDGTKIDYSWIIYFPKDVPAIKVSSAISVINGAETVLTDTVKRFSRGQLNARAWL